MNVSVYFKSASAWRLYTMDDDEFKRLEADYSKYLDGKSLKGGSYTMTSVDGHAPKTARTVLLAFDDISFG